MFNSMAEGHSTLLYIGAGNVQFDGRNFVKFVNDGGRFGIIFDGRSRHIHNHIGSDVLDAGIDVFNKVMYTLILQSHSV